VGLAFRLLQTFAIETFYRSVEENHIKGKIDLVTTLVILKLSYLLKGGHSQFSIYSDQKYHVRNRT
jgi:hypothetical protein